MSNSDKIKCSDIKLSFINIMVSIKFCKVGIEDCTCEALELSGAWGLWQGPAGGCHRERKSAAALTGGRASSGENVVAEVQ